jgi:hypothetical protein
MRECCDGIVLSKLSHVQYLPRFHMSNTPLFGVGWNGVVWCGVKKIQYSEKLNVLGLKMLLILQYVIREGGL